ncbi:ribose transport system ATP-binding protein [Methylobacterium sp. ap11]|uniref:sugar ABC transporter ATP-binding protein n=1 Tax=Methylobacterium sp. ap11 TaxID=1761799 RepID=UPI0008C228AB|nr:sugar ABC transporter ATP-binding protein [Methylobacterium sp. ap11]SEP07509.1 ribose transport system ATP-binding protein [Methylobacterium sp. ap11]
MASDAPLRLHIQGLTKRFPGVVALGEMSLRVRPGEVHALLGENGAGKSTLMRILSGVLRPDEGTIAVDGEELTLRSPLAARRAGIAMIHQELQQVPELTVAQNMFLGRALRRGGLFVDRARQEALAAEALAPLDASIRPDAPIRSLRVAQRQIVEIARALLDNARIIAMDEPTSSLTPSEFERLAAVIAGLAARGVSIIYVSHKMDEVFRICSRATIMRDGRFVADLDLAGTTEGAVVAQMVGRELAVAEHRSSVQAETVLSVRGLSAGTKVVDASFDLRRGEVLGIAGLIGSGRTELLRLIAGADRRSSGTVAVNGRPLARAGTRAAIAAGIGLVPEERKRDGIVPQRSMVANVALPSMPRFAPRGVVRGRRLRAEAGRLLAEVNLRPMQIDRPIRLFSGGNQQKGIIARWIAAGTQILLFDEPTRGIDIGAKAEIYGLIERLAAEGKSIIVVSSELPELLRLSDRVLVMRQGRIAAELPREALSEQAIVAHAVPQSVRAA